MVWRAVAGRRSYFIVQAGTVRQTINHRNCSVVTDNADLAPSREDSLLLVCSGARDDQEHPFLQCSLASREKSPAFLH